VLAIHLIATKENTGGYSNGAALGYPDRWVRENFDIRLALDSVSTSIGVLEPFARTKNLLLCNGGDFMEPQAELPEVIKYLNKHLPNAHVVHSTYADYIQDVEKHRASLATYAGELRRARFMPLLVNILSSRLYVKQKNFAAQTALEHYAEPLAVFASLAGKAYPAALLTQAWKYFIQTHPHDTICGCSIDKVHEDGLQRAEWSQQISAVLAAQSVDHLLAQHRAGDPRHDGIAVVNTLPWPRREEVVVDGATCLLDVPACGYKIYDRAEVQALASCVSAGSERSLENARVKVEVKANGTLTLTDKATGVTYAGLNYFEDVEDTGDLYTYFPADVSQTISTLQEAAPSVEKRDGKLVISYDLRLPARVEEDYSRRSTEMVACPLTTTVSLAGDSPLVRISTSFENTAKDHRLRVGFQPGIHATASLADGQFQVVERPLGADPEDWIKEPATGESAQQHFVIIRDEQKGLLVANKGLPEYQLTEEGKLYVTLARCVEWINSLGWVNRKVRQLPQNRMGHAPGGQCPGRHTCEYAVMPIAGAWEECLHDVYNYIVPVTVRETHGVPPAEQSYFTLEPQPLLISAIKQAEASDNIIVRIYNPTEKPVSGLLRTFVKPKKAYLTQLNESRIRQLPAKRGGIALEVAPYKIVTLELAFPGKAEKE
jgi:alpha-mannosidase